MDERVHSGSSWMGKWEHPMEMKPNILLIITGGTMTMINDGESNSLKPHSVAEHIKELPELNNPLLPTFQIYEWPQLVDSSEVGHEEWNLIAEQIEKSYDECEGFVVIHGTDTMAYTASALSFMLQNLKKPVVLTGAMLPLSHMCTDAHRNLPVAMTIAAYSHIAEVCVLFGNRLLRGNRTRKIDCEQMNAFYSPNFPPLGRVGVTITVDRGLVYEPSPLDLCVRNITCSNVMIIKLTPGLNSKLLTKLFEDAGIRPLGIILELFGSGTSARNSEFVNFIETVIGAGIHVAAVTQCLKGACVFSAYENGVMLSKVGVISCFDMTPEAAYCKMAYLLGNGYSGEELHQMMITPMCGEISLGRIKSCSHRYSVQHAVQPLGSDTLKVSTVLPCPVIRSIYDKNTECGSTNTDSVPHTPNADEHIKMIYGGISDADSNNYRDLSVDVGSPSSF